jgi:hypothetical protein
MAVLKIRKAKRAGARLVLGLAGQSGDGKTFTALQLAWGLAGFNAGKVGFIDTENKRGSLYADSLKDAAGVIHEFLIGDLEPPFSPARYAEAIKEFQAAGVEVLVIDSISHEHEGTGGLLEMREPLPGQRGKRDNFAKAEHKKMMNVLLQSNMHIICCVRARETVHIERIGNETKYIPQGVQPITEKNFMFEMTASLMMQNRGLQQTVLKCPADLAHILGRESGHITAADGEMLRAWVDGGEQLNAPVEKAKSDLQLVCEQGLAALTAAWKALPAAVRKAIQANGACPEQYKASAQAFDDLRTQGDDSTAGLESLNDQVLGGAAA